MSETDVLCFVWLADGIDLSLEFLMGRALDNAVLNLDLKQQYKESTEASTRLPNAYTP